MNFCSLVKEATELHMFQQMLKFKPTKPLVMNQHDTRICIEEKANTRIWYDKINLILT